MSGDTRYGSHKHETAISDVIATMNHGGLWSMATTRAAVRIQLPSGRGGGCGVVVQLTMIARYLVVVAAVAFDADLSLPAPALLMLIVLAGAAVLAPVMRVLVRKVLRALSSAPNGPPGPGSAADARDVRTPTDPGTPGTVRARAPSHGVHAFA
ncbi:hypothetical protein AB0I28_14385 [Phytomonospora sp. NPDC050363]|uniref:hypothetical protein n=1 Tax=Phytomonospora sp. NPDC050363 TaxID=3155642 RepID=UPI0033ECCEF0